MVLQDSRYMCPVMSNAVALPLPLRLITHFTTQVYHHTTDTKCKIFLHEFLLLEMKEACMVLSIFPVLILIWEAATKT